MKLLDGLNDPILNHGDVEALYYRAIRLTDGLLEDIAATAGWLHHRVENEANPGNPVETWWLKAGA